MSSGARRPVAITGATLIDGSGRPPLVDATIVFDGDRIARVGPTMEGPPPEGAEIIDARGRFVIPGLTDMHVHVLGPDRWHSALFLAAGVTTVLDLGGQLPDLTALRDAIYAGTTPGPRLLYTGPFLEEGEPFAGFAHMARRVDAARIEHAVDELADAGVHAIKLYVTITPQTATRACARAHERGLRVFMHQQETWGADAAGAGVDCVEHMMVFGALAPEALRPTEPGRLTPFEYGGWMWRWLDGVDPRDDAVSRLFDRLIAADTALDPTLVLFSARPGALGDDVGDTRMDDPERTPILPVLPPRVREDLVSRWAERRRAATGASARAADRTRRGWEHLLALVDRFHRAGRHRARRHRLSERGDRLRLLAAPGAGAARARGPHADGRPASRDQPCGGAPRSRGRVRNDRPRTGRRPRDPRRRPAGRHPERQAHRARDRPRPRLGA